MMLNKTSKYMSLPLQLYKMGPLQNKVTWYKKNETLLDAK